MYLCTCTYSSEDLEVKGSMPSVNSNPGERKCNARVKVTQRFLCATTAGRNATY